MHLLVYPRILRHDGQFQLENPHRELQVHAVWWGSDTDAYTASTHTNTACADTDPDSAAAYSDTDTASPHTDPDPSGNAHAGSNTDSLSYA